MTDAASKKANNQEKMQGQHTMRTTHPAYTEYSWSSLTRNSPPPRTANTSARNNPQPNVKRTTAARQAPANNISGQTRRAQPMGAPMAANYRTGPRPKTQPASSVKPRAAAKTASKAASTVKEKAAKIRTKSITTLHTIVVEKRYSFPLSIVVIALSITILVLAIITTSVRVSEITSENSELQRTYNALVADENELRLLLETRDDLRVVEDMATNELGMIKKDQADKYYLTIYKEDRIELVEEQEAEKKSIFEGLLAFGGSIVERIRAFFGL